MAIEVILPALGMAQDTGKILRWLKAEGEPVRKGELLAEIETDKAVVEIEASTDGFLARMREDCKEDGPIRYAFDCRDNVLAVAIGSAGIHYSNAARSDDEGGVRGSPAILRRDLAPGPQ